jgi:hypothetical protein
MRLRDRAAFLVGGIVVVAYLWVYIFIFGGFFFCFALGHKQVQAKFSSVGSSERVFVPDSSENRQASLPFFEQGKIFLRAQSRGLRSGKKMLVRQDDGPLILSVFRVFDRWLVPDWIAVRLQSQMFFQRWQLATIYKLHLDFHGFSTRDSRVHFQYTQPRSLIQFKIIVSIHYALMSVLSYLLIGTPDQNSNEQITKDHNGSNNFHPKFYGLTSALLFLFGSFLVAKGWWNAHYGDRPVYQGLLIWGTGGMIIGAAVLLFGFHC